MINAPKKPGIGRLILSYAVTIAVVFSLTNAPAIVVAIEGDGMPVVGKTASQTGKVADAIDKSDQILSTQGDDPEQQPGDQQPGAQEPGTQEPGAQQPGEQQPGGGENPATGTGAQSGIPSEEEDPIEEPPTSFVVYFLDDNGERINPNGTVYERGQDIEFPPGPSRESTNSYRYEFAGWEIANGSPESDFVEFRPTFDSFAITYTVTFLNWDDSVIKSTDYHYNGVAEEPEETPTRPAEGVTTYTFAGWDTEFEPLVTANATYRATYSETIDGYKVTFVDYDGAILGSRSYPYDVEPEMMDDPFREADGTYTYEFTGWSRSEDETTGDVTFTATYEGTYIEYTVRFLHPTSGEISSAKYHYGEMPVAPAHVRGGEDVYFKYEFSRWDADIAPVTASVDYTAVFDKVYQEYTVTFQDWDRSIISSRNYHYNDSIYVPDNPTREGDALKSYRFLGWDPDPIDKVNGNAVYTATYIPVDKEYEISFLDGNGNVIASGLYAYGDRVTAPQDVTREGYTFDGWWPPFASIATGDAEYVAQWSTGEYELKYVIDGVEYASQSYAYGAEVTAPAAPPRRGYTFEGWTELPGFMPGSDLTVTAVYKANVYDLAVHYRYEDNSEAAPTHVESIAYGNDYSVVSPQIEGCKANLEVVTGTMGSMPMSVTVTYKSIAPIIVPDDADNAGEGDEPDADKVEDPAQDDGSQPSQDGTDKPALEEKPGQSSADDPAQNGADKPAQGEKPGQNANGSNSGTTNAVVDKIKDVIESSEITGNAGQSANSQSAEYGAERASSVSAALSAHDDIEVGETLLDDANPLASIEQISDDATPMASAPSVSQEGEGINPFVILAIAMGVALCVFGGLFAFLAVKRRKEDE